MPSWSDIEILEIFYGSKRKSLIAEKHLQQHNQMKKKGEKTHQTPQNTTYCVCYLRFPEISILQKVGRYQLMRQSKPLHRKQMGNLVFKKSRLTTLWQKRTIYKTENNKTIHRNFNIGHYGIWREIYLIQPISLSLKIFI